jgi:hypothetical protein
MEKNHVIFALKRKRAELPELIPEVERRLESLRQGERGYDPASVRSPESR